MGLQSFAIEVLDELAAIGVRSAILAGGALRAQLDNTRVRDYDLFFRCEADYLRAERIMAAVWARNIAPTGTHSFTAPSGREYNLIGFRFGTVEEVLDGFDFRCCQHAAFFIGPVIQFRSFDGAIDDALARRITVVGNNGTRRELKRIKKYVDDYGYTLAMVPERATSESLLRRVVRTIRRAPRRGAGY